MNSHNNTDDFLPPIASYITDMSIITNIIIKYPSIKHEILYNYDIYNTIKRYIDNDITYEDLRQYDRQYIPHRNMCFRILLCYTSDRHVNVMLQFYICEYDIKYIKSCHWDLLCDEVLKYCIHSRTLNARDNRKITTCDPFADTLEILDASYRCGIGDNGLKNCHKLKQLKCKHNRKITTCDPFAETLEELDISRDVNTGIKYGGIDYDGLKNCHKIKRLNVANNPTILQTNLLSKQS